MGNTKHTHSATKADIDHLENIKRFFAFFISSSLLFSLCACGAGSNDNVTKIKPTANEDDIAQLEAAYKDRQAFHGNLHDHSDSGDPANDPWKTADGKYRIELWPNFLASADLDFVALVDHRQTNHMRLDAWDETMFMGATETGHRRLDTGNEIDAMHYNILMNDPDELDRILSNFDKFNCTGKGHFKIYSNNPLTEEEFSQLVGMIQDAGGIVVHVHPCYEGYMSSEDPMDYVIGEYTGMEILCSYSGNMSFEANADAYKLWVELLNMGQHIYAFAGSDSHRQTDTISTSTVYAEERLNDSYLKHIVKGDFTAGPVGIRMCIGDTVMGSHTTFSGKRLVIAVDDFQSKEYKSEHQYRLDLYNENGLVLSQEFDSKEAAYFAIDAEDCKYYRADIYDVTADYIFAIGNPIWNE